MTIDYQTQEEQTEKTASSLPDEYYKEYQKLSSKLRRDALPGKERAEALEGLLILLGRAQAQNRPAVSIYGGDFKGFYHELLCGMETALPLEFRQKRAFFKKCTLAALAALCVLAAAGWILWRSAPVHIAFDDLSFFESNKAYVLTREKADAPIRFTLDLEKGKVITNRVVWKDDRCRIVLEKLSPDETGAWIAVFRMIGSCDKTGGRLVTPLSHAAFADFSSYELSKKLTVQAQGKTYFAEPAGAAAFESKNSDLLAWSLFPSGTSLSDIAQAQTVTLSFENLSILQWKQNGSSK